MQRDWTLNELHEHWTLLPEEKELALSKRGVLRLGFAILLKCFRHEGRFPYAPHDVPTAVVAYLAEQLPVDAGDWPGHAWESRALKYHRAEIRKLLGFREATVGDGEALEHDLES